MIARGAIHNPKIFEEFKNSFDQFDLDEERNSAEKEFNEDDLDNDVLEIKEDNNPIKHNKSNRNLNDDGKDKDLKGDEDNKKEESKKSKKKNKNEDNEVKTSQNLARIFDMKYQGRKFDLHSIIKDYLIFVIFFY